MGYSLVMAAASTFPFWDSLYGGRLCALLAEWHDRGLSFRAISEQMGEDKGLTPPGRETLRRWCAPAGECAGCP